MELLKYVPKHHFKVQGDTKDKNSEEDENEKPKEYKSKKQNYI